ncbi:MAG: hypothetical protein ACSHX8_15645 [Opitutaceae bacterium]
MKAIIRNLVYLLCLAVPLLHVSAKEAVYKVDSISLDGGADASGGNLVITASLGGHAGQEQEEARIYSVDVQSKLNVNAKSLQQETLLLATHKHGELKEIVLNYWGDLEVDAITGDNITLWSVRHLAKAAKGKQAAGPERQLVIVLTKPITSGTVACTISSSYEMDALNIERRPLLFSNAEAGFLSGGIEIVSGENVRAEAIAVKGLVALQSESTDIQKYRVAEAGQNLSLKLSPMREPALSFNNFNLSGSYKDERARFVLTGTIESFYDQESRIPLLSGNAAFVKAPKIPGAKVTFDQSYWLEIDKAGTYPINLEFEALVKTENGQSSVEFDLIDAPLQPVSISQLPARLDLVTLNGAPLGISGQSWVSSLSGDGIFKMSWTDPSWKSPQAADASLIYSTQNIAQVAVGNGLIRQRNDIDVQIMQGSMKTLHFDLKGAGEITRVESAAILNWKIEEGVLKLDLNKSYTENFSIRIQSQYSMAAFPVEADPLRILPQNAIRHSGFIRILNQGAVSIDVTDSTGFAQISPEFFPAVESAMQSSGQVLAYRFSDTRYDYTVRADNVLPEVAVSQILQYHIGQEDQSITAEMELTIREAPLRDFFIQIPQDYALVDLKVKNLADYFITEDDKGGRTLRLVFSQPQSGRVLISAALENNRSLETDSWSLPGVFASDVKSVRGHIGVSTDPGLRVSAADLEGLSEQAANFFPKKVPNLQLALRLREPAWKAGLKVEQLPQSIQVDALHLYSVAEGRIYGSSVINYLVSGAPVSKYQIQVPEGLQNLDFAGRDVRGWSHLGDNLYEVQLHSSAAGAYTLLATYESQVGAGEAAVDFSGVTPVGVDAEQGYVVVVSNFPFALGEVQTSEAILRLEPGEIPDEFRLLYDAQELAAFQYSDRPMQVALELRSFEQAKSTDQVIDFVDLKSHISRDGQILTAVDLMLKSKGQTHFRMALPTNHQIWTARVAGNKVSPIQAEGGVLLPLPTGQDPNNAVRIQMELASQAEDANRPIVTAPALFAPSLIVNWELTSDPDYGLSYRGGDISSPEMSQSPTGFSWFRALLAGELGTQRLLFFAMIFFGLFAIVLARAVSFGFQDRVLIARIILVLAFAISSTLVVMFGLGIGATGSITSNLQDSLTLRTPIELSDQPLSLIVENRDYSNTSTSLGALWPFILGIGLWVYAFVRDDKSERFLIAGWVVNFLAALHYVPSGALFVALLIAFFFVNMVRPFRVRYLERIGSHALWLLGFISVLALSSPTLDAATQITPEELTQSIVVDDGFAIAEAQLNWTAEADEQVILLWATGTLLSTSELPEGLRIVEEKHAQGLRFNLYADSAGEYEVKFRYQVEVLTGKSSRIILPTGAALSSRARVEISDTNIGLDSQYAVSIQELTGAASDKSVFDLIFKPGGKRAFGWLPKQRDTSEENAAFHVESFDIFTPLAGLVSGYHQHKVRLSQGQIDRLQILVPKGMTITSVVGAPLASWQFDPESNQLLCFFSAAQTTAFDLDIFSQYSAGTLPYSLPVKSLQVVDAASQLALVAIATDNEVQIGEVQSGKATAINLEDFPVANLQKVSHLGQAPVLRRAYRWNAQSDAVTIQAVAVQPDVRVTSKETVSLGEDRILLKAEIAAQISRAGLFKFSMAIPEDYDVESVSGQNLSHWNELVATDGTRSLQLHLKGKTMGETQVNVSLSGPGLGERKSYSPPILKLDGTARQSGSIALIPELGYRLNPTHREAALQLDPADSGMSRQKMLLFRILNSQAELDFSVERVAPWVEVERLQRVTVRSGLVEFKTRFKFNVENAGTREQGFMVHPDAIGVQVTGEGVVDTEVGDSGNVLVKFNRKMVGAFTLELSYQVPLSSQAETIATHLDRAINVDQQSGFLALVPQGRIQLRPMVSGDALQSSEVQMVSAKLRGDLKLDSASHVFKMNQPVDSLNVAIQHLNIAELVPAQVSNVELTSVISGQGSMLTKVTLKLDPGDKRMLRITLPENSEFWFGFVNQQSVWPWREGADVLLQLEANATAAEDSTVEFFYATNSVVSPTGKLRARFMGPRLDLPLENIRWSINYPETWEIKEWEGNLTQDDVQYRSGSFWDLSSYMKYEAGKKLRQKAVAENFLNSANTLLSQGKQQEARLAFNNAYNLSQFDDALNEDARVQLKNVREDQALVALANRRNQFVNDNGLSIQSNQAPQVVIEQGRLLNYTAQTKQDLLGGNTKEDNETFRLLAARLIDQQQAVPGNPQAIQTMVPQQGQVVSFTRSLQINDQADLIIELKGKRSNPTGQAGLGLGMLLLLIVMVGGVSYVSRK